MKVLLNIVIMLSCSHILRSSAFIYSTSRNVHKSGVIMKSKKKNLSSLDREDNVPQRRKKKMTPKYEPRSDNQKDYVKYLNDESCPIVLGIGPAGCGKTMFACLQAIQELKSGDVDKIILTRPIVPVEEEELGFLPGNLVKKMDPWTRPVFDIFSEFFQQRDIENMIHCGVLEISPLAYMRGRTFKRSFIIADEMQNSTPNQMLMLTTRIGEHSKMVITGDLKQSDRSANNGLLDFMQKLENYQEDLESFDKQSRIELVKMNSYDVQRSPIVSHILNIYNSEDHNNENMHDTLEFTDYDRYNYDNKFKNGSGDAALLPLKDIPKKDINPKDWFI